MNAQKPAFPALSALGAILTRIGRKNFPRGSAETRNQPSCGTIIAANAAQAVPAVVGVSNEIPRPADDGSRWWPVAPRGEYPVRIRDAGGQLRTVVQVIDDEAIREMISAFNSSLRGMLQVGLPIFDGHADDPEFARHDPSLRPHAVGRIKQLELRDDGLWGRVAINAQGAALVDGDAPAVAYQSPRWFMQAIPERPGHYRPVRLASLALTNTPNLPRDLVTVAGRNEAEPETTEPESNHSMPPWLIELLKSRLGSAEATEETVKAALVKLLADADARAQAEADKTAAEAKKAEAETSATKASEAAANSQSRAESLARELAEVRRSRAELVVANAVRAGRIVEAQRAQTLESLVAAANEADWTAAVAKVENLTPAVNTQPFRGGSATPPNRSQAERIAAINREVDAYAAEKKVTRDEAWAALKKDKPALFA